MILSNMRVKKGADQTVQMCRLVWTFVVRKPEDRSCRVEAHMIAYFVYASIEGRGETVQAFMSLCDFPMSIVPKSNVLGNFCYFGNQPGSTL